jgi:cellobiose phosphorylase
MWYTVSQFILGIKPQYDGLLIDPCLPEVACDYTVYRRFRDAEYEISVHPNGSQKGVKSVVLDGETVESGLVPYSPGKHTVDVVM